MREIEGERSYASRVTDIYRRVETQFGREKAEVFNAVLRGAGLLDEDNRFLCEVENTRPEDLGPYVKGAMNFNSSYCEVFGDKSIDDFFQRVANEGRTKLYIWNGDEYQQVLVEKDEEKFLPWGGEIKCRYLTRIMKGVVYFKDISLHDDMIVCDGHTFSLDKK